MARNPIKLIDCSTVAVKRLASAICAKCTEYPVGMCRQALGMISYLEFRSKASAVAFNQEFGLELLHSKAIGLVIRLREGRLMQQ